MIRFPNPGSNINQFIDIFQTLHKHLNTNSYFTLDDMSAVLTKQGLAASCGYVGKKALELSTRKDRSRDPLYNQSKMYAELYRLIGWMGSSPGSALEFKFTYLGDWAAQDTKLARNLFLESIIGISYPNNVLKSKFNEESRVFATILSTAKKLDGFISRDEMIIGPLSCDDTYERARLDMVNNLKDARKSVQSLHKKLDDLSTSLGVTVNTLHNYTRFPIGVMKASGWFEKTTDPRIYNKKIEVFKLTPKGHAKEEEIANSKDIRLSEYLELSRDKQLAVTRLGFYSMLENAGYDVSHYAEQKKIDWNLLYPSTPVGKILYSPYQTLSVNEVNELLDKTAAPTTKQSFSSISESEFNVTESSNFNSPYVESNVYIKQQKVHSSPKAEYSKDKDANSAGILDSDVYTKIISYHSEGKKESEIVNQIFSDYRYSKKEIFYPLVADLFKILGFNCICMRNGINYERSDALIDDPEHSIPIEIKSPTEEEFISVKAVRQALENKIILLSRKTHITDNETTSLVVGYKLPNNRAEVTNLVHDIKQTYNINIGIIDFKSLVKLAVSKIIGTGTVNLSEIRELKGLINVQFRK